MEYELYHHGILGMHWGIRRFQNKDGSLTAAGRKRYGLPEKIAVASKTSETKKWINNPASGKEIVAQTIASQVKNANEDISKEILDRVNSQRDKANDLAIKVEKMAVDETNKAINSLEFKNELEKRLYKELGNGVDDFELYALTQDELINQMLSERDYTPKTNALMREFKKEADKYFEDTKQAADEIVKDLKDVPVAKLKSGSVNYSDVVKYVIRQNPETAYLCWFYRHSDEVFYNEGIGMDDTMSFEWYNKKYGIK